MPHQEWGALYQEYLNAMAGCLAALQEDGGDTAATARLERLADEATKLKLSVLLRHPNQELALRKRSNALTQEAAALARGGFRHLMTFEYKWQLVEDAQLSPRQQEAVKAVRRRYLGNVALLSTRRDELEATLQQDPAAHGNAGPDFGSMQRAIAGIGETLCREHACLLKAVAAVFSVLTPRQFAHVHVGAAPAHPNAMCLAEMVAMTTGEPHAQALVQQLRGQGWSAMQMASTPDVVPINTRRQTPPSLDLPAQCPSHGHPAANAPASMAAIFT